MQIGDANQYASEWEQQHAAAVEALAGSKQFILFTAKHSHPQVSEDEESVQLPFEMFVGGSLGFADACLADLLRFVMASTLFPGGTGQAFLVDPPE